MILFIGVFLLPVTAWQSLAQTGVTGKVVDANTMEGLPFAHVFINQTTIGTVTNQEGQYTLVNVPAGENTMVFSFVGYISYQTKIQVKEGAIKQLDIRLQPDEKQLEAVEIEGTRDKAWEKQEKKFEKVFLGNTRFAESARILNPWVLEFKEIKSANGKEVFMATASLPIEIENNALGYRVFYYLQDLMSNSSGFSIKGQVRFEELTTEDPKKLKTWNQNRVENYKGSLRHLIKAILNDQVEEEGFNLYVDVGPTDNSLSRSTVFSELLNKSIQPFAYQHSVQPGKTAGEFVIPVKQKLEIHYRPKYSSVKVYNDVTCPVSWLEVGEGFLRANSMGIVLNPPFAIVSGAMYDNRVANLLPFNYSPD